MSANFPAFDRCVGLLQGVKFDGNLRGTLSFYPNGPQIMRDSGFADMRLDARSLDALVAVRVARREARGPYGKNYVEAAVHAVNELDRNIFRILDEWEKRDV